MRCSENLPSPFRHVPSVPESGVSANHQASIFAYMFALGALLNSVLRLKNWGVEKSAYRTREQRISKL